MLSTLALATVASSGIVVVDGIGVGIYDGAKWRSMDSIMVNSWPKKTISDSEVAAIVAMGGYKLSKSGEATSADGDIKFGGDDQGPGDRGWVLGERANDVDVVRWFGVKPTPAKVTFGATSSAVYKKAVSDYLATKGLRKTKPFLYTVALADLDANGTQEALIFAGSRTKDTIYEAYAGNFDAKKPADYSVAMIRYISGGKVKVAPLYYSDGRKSGLEGNCTFAGLANLDGKPGLEIIYRWGAYEAWSGRVSSFSNGKVKLLAEAGDGS